MLPRLRPLLAPPTGARLGWPPAHSIHSAPALLARVLSSTSLSWAELASSPTGRERIAAKRQEYERKYADQLQRKVKENGLHSVEELKRLAEARKAEDRTRTEEFAKQVLEKAKAERVVTRPAPAPPAKPGSPMKPLDSILDLEKLRTESAATISQLWNAYHLSKADKLSAVIPVATYEAMLSVARRYPSFVVPLPRRGAVAAAAESVRPGQTEVKVPVEMQFLQWAILPHPSAPSPTTAPPPTSVLYTPLAEFKLRQSFAQPTLILSHYTDLAESHGLVLMRGDLTKDVGGKLDGAEAQLLVLRLQQFYHWTAGSGPAASDAQEDAEANLRERARTELRRGLLRDFHERPGEFAVDQLVELAGDV